MFTWRTGRQFLMRTTLLTVVATSLVIAIPQEAGARPTGGAGRAGANGDTFAAMCRAAGGTPTWTTSIDSTGTVTYIVECDGGYLDGLNCFFDEEFTSCSMTRFVQDSSDLIVEPDGIAPLDEPVKVPDKGSVDGPVTLAPLEDETPAPPAPEPGDGQVIEPVVIEPVVSDGEMAPEATATPGGDVDSGPVVDDVVVSDEPAVSDGGAAPTRDPSEIKPQIDLEHIAPMEPIILT